MSTTSPEITKEEDVWVVRILKDNGRLQTYRCASESQARALLLVLSPPLANVAPDQRS